MKNKIAKIIVTKRIAGLILVPEEEEEEDEEETHFSCLKSIISESKTNLFISRLKTHLKILIIIQTHKLKSIKFKSLHSD